MLKKDQSLAIYMDHSLLSDYGKMGFGLMRYSQNPISCVVDTEFAGKTIREVTGLPYDIKIVGDLSEAIKLQAEVFVLGIAPSGGKIPESWNAPIEIALQNGLSVINGLHDKVATKFGHLIKAPNQWIWDIRIPSFIPQIAAARAAKLSNKRVLLVGTDMAVGKMTTGLELYNWFQAKKVNAAFLATGQIGISIMGKGIPLDAFIVDHAAGAVETIVLEEADKDIVIIEGQGSLLHPGSTATLPLMRGSCATHLILCHRADMRTLRNPSAIKIPDLSEFIQLNEALSASCGSLTKAKTVGIALNTSKLSEQEALAYIDELEAKTGLPVTDVVRYGASKLGQVLLGVT